MKGRCHPLGPDAEVPRLFSVAGNKTGRRFAPAIAVTHIFQTRNVKELNGAIEHTEILSPKHSAIEGIKVHRGLGKNKSKSIERQRARISRSLVSELRTRI
jgi:hypothetical protein